MCQKCRDFIAAMDRGEGNGYSVITLLRKAMEEPKQETAQETHDPEPKTIGHYAETVQKLKHENGSLREQIDNLLDQNRDTHNRLHEMQDERDVAQRFAAQLAKRYT